MSGSDALTKCHGGLFVVNAVMTEVTPYSRTLPLYALSKFQGQVGGGYVAVQPEVASTQ